MLSVKDRIYFAHDEYEQTVNSASDAIFVTVSNSVHV